jgi:hypothetical protein
MIVSNQGNFREENFQRAMSSLQSDEIMAATAKKTRKVTSKGQSSDLAKIIG